MSLDSGIGSGLDDETGNGLDEVPRSIHVGEVTINGTLTIGES